MQRILIFLLAVFMLGGCARQPPLVTVAHVDLTRYQGDWFVIANIPYWLEDGKVATFDRYRLREDGRMDNEYWFRRGDFSAKEEVWEGVAWVHDTTTNAEWRVRFLWPFSAEYFIIDLDTNYQWAAIGHPSRDYFWILARERTLPPNIYAEILQRSAAQGYDITRIKMVPQPQ